VNKLGFSLANVLGVQTSSKVVWEIISVITINFRVVEKSMVMLLGDFGLFG
jgi:hypothetical protein